MRLLAVPNISEGRDAEVIAAIAVAFERDGVQLLDTHSDPDHNRSVFTLKGEAAQLPLSLLAGARVALERIDLREHEGVHPNVGVLDVVPLVYLSDEQRGVACAAALVTAELLGLKLDLPVFLYGELAGGRTRSELREGGIKRLTERIEAGELEPDFGPGRIHPTAGAVLVSARPPLIAFNVNLAAPATLADAQRIAAAIREGGAEGLVGVRAVGLELTSQGVIQVSTNIEDWQTTSPAQVVEAVTREAEIGEVELVGMAPAEAFADFPAELLESGGFDRRQLFTSD